MNSRSRTLSNTLFSSVGTYTEYVLGMLTSIVIARHLGPDGFGTYSLVIWLVAMGVAITNSGTASAAIKFVAELRGTERTEMVPYLLDYLRRAQRIFLLVVLLAGAAVFIFGGDHIAPGMNHKLLLGFLVVAVALRSSYMFNIGVAKGFENFRATATVALISTPINLLLVLLAWRLDAPVEWLLAVFVISSFVFFGISFRQIAPLVPARQPGVQLPAPLLGRVRRHMGWTALTVSVGFMAASEVEVMFLNMYADSHAAGQFKVAYQLAIGAAMLVPGVFGALLLPMMANALSRGREVAAQRFVATTGYLVLLAAPLAAFGVVFCNDVIHLLYGREYYAAGPVFAVCLVAACLTTMTQGGSSLLVSADRQRSILVLVIICALLKVVLDAVLIAHFALTGAVIAYITVATLNATVYMTLATRVSHAHPEWGRLARILLAAALAGLLALPLRGLLPIASVLAGGAVLVLAYIPLTLLLGCWSRGDIEHLQHLHQRFAAGRPRLGARFLAWAYQRAPGEGTP
ncbi:oligosaccharide flippase family protein [Pseudoxanthomonas beigongshangi]|jgi:O-antigen/teichoic acid export membrane protein